MCELTMRGGGVKFHSRRTMCELTMRGGGLSFIAEGQCVN